MQFLTEAEPPRGVALPVLPGISRIVAANPGAMTYHGTNTWLIAAADGFSVLDPGPDDAAHVAHILAATSGRVARILLSHTHADHVGALPALRAATGAPVAAFAAPQIAGIDPDIRLADGDAIAGWTALHTPGHASDHLCFARADGVLFSADHVMSWSSSIISPPQGDMRAYFASLHRLLARADTVYLPGHGPPITEPRPFALGLLAHRQAREDAVLAALPGTPEALVEAIYVGLAERLRAAATRNVVAHLGKLVAEGRVAERAGVYAPIP